MVRHSRLAGVVIAALVVGAVTGCSRASEELQRVQRAVGTGAQAALVARPDEAPAPSDVAPANQVPVPELALDGSLRFTPDANHRNVTGARSATGFVVAWTDAPQAAVYVGLLDHDRRAHGQGTRLHTVASDEETLAAPAVVVTPEGSAIAWADRDNGRIRFARLDAHGALRGTVAIVHDGVDAPRTVALGWNGHEFGVAAALREGVYFTRVGVDGARLGEAQVIAEGEAVHSLDAVAWDGRAFDLAFTVRHDGRNEQVRARIARTDRRG